MNTRRLATASAVIEADAGLGGKILSLIDPTTGHEYLATPTNRHHAAAYGAPFEESDLSGWDECFPAIGAGHHPAEAWRGTEIPDHGELWTQSWEDFSDVGTIRFRVDGVRFPYTFERTIASSPCGLVFGYRVVNRSAFDFPCAWSAHPLFAATETTRILLPTENVRLQMSVSGRFGRLLDALSWPVATTRDGRTVNLGRLGSPLEREAEKLYSDRLGEGWAGFLDDASGQWLVFGFDPSPVPFVGFWANLGAWPTARPVYHFALEPCTARPDRLDIAMERGEHMLVEAGCELSWTVEVRIGRGRDALTETVKEFGGDLADSLT